MLTKELSIAGRAQPVFIEPMQVVPIAELFDGARGATSPNLTGIDALQQSEVVASYSGHLFAQCGQLLRDFVLIGHRLTFKVICSLNCRIRIYVRRFLDLKSIG
jgi:hypothetical protein